MLSLDPYSSVWAGDFEFYEQTGDRPSPVCFVARELRSGRLVRYWIDQLREMRTAPFPTDDKTLFVSYHAPAELGCFKELGWPMPSRILDLCCEFKNLTSGLDLPVPKSFLNALTYFGLDCMTEVEKETMQQLVLRGGPFTSEVRKVILDYCQNDVDSLIKLLRAMIGKISIDHALLRGRYTAAVAEMEWCGVPIDTTALGLFQEKWLSIQDQLIERIDKDFCVFEGRTFKHDQFANYLAKNRIPWPRLDSGNLALDNDTFRDMAKAYPVIAPLRELRTAISQLRLNKLAIGSDGRNRCMLSPFGSKTGRNQPSTSKFIFGPSTWIRSLIRPNPGMALAYIDWSQQELAIAACLSGDQKMQEAYRSGDFYMTFAKMAGAAPPNATKQTHSAVRAQFKEVALGVLYGLSAESLALKLNISSVEGRYLLNKHKETFKWFWRWSDAVEDEALLTGVLQTAFGWKVHVGNQPNPRSFRNFPMQGNGAEMMRLACCMATESGIRVCCPVHDALLIEASSEEIEKVVLRTQEIMHKASEIVLPGFPLTTEAKIIRYPERYSDPRGKTMWKTVCELSGMDPK